MTKEEFQTKVNGLTKEGYQTVEIIDVTSTQSTILNNRVVPSFLEDLMVKASESASVLNDGKSSTYYTVSASFKINGRNRFAESSPNDQEDAAFDALAESIVLEASI